MTRLVFKIQGMDCSEEVAILRRRSNGVRQAVPADQEGHFAAETPREPNQAFVMFT